MRLTHRADARRATRRDLAGELRTSPRSLKTRRLSPFAIPRFLRIERIYPHLTATGGLQNINIAGQRMGTGFIVKAKRLLSGKVFRFRIVPSFKSRGINRQWAYPHVAFRQLGTGDM